MTSADTADWLDAPSIGGFLLNSSSGSAAANASVSTPVFYCGSSPFLILELFQTLGGSGSHTLSFWSDAAGTQAVGTPQTWLSQAVGLKKRLVVPPQGAYCSVAFHNGPNAGNAWSIAVFGASQPVTPAGSLGGGLVVYQVLSTTVGAGGTTNISPTIYVPGRAHLWVTTATGCYVSLQRYDGTAFRTILTLTGVTGGNEDTEVILPADDFQLALINTTGSNQTFQAAIVAE